MTKRNQKSHKKILQSAAALRANGMKAFQAGNLDQAIATWEKIAGEARPWAALAEAYFRRGLARFYGAKAEGQAGLEDLQQASRCLPGDACYAYHLGLAMHHSGNLPEAVGAYGTARRSGGSFARRAAYPLALALLQQGRDPAQDLVWADLSEQERQRLVNAAQFRRRPFRVTPDAPPLWRGLAALDQGARSAAQAGLEEALDSSQAALEKGLAQYYLGVLAAQQEDWQAARRAWGSAHASGLQTAALEENLGELYHRMAEELLSAGDVQTALEAAEEASRHKQDDRALDELQAHLHQRLGYEAASANRWNEAQEHWQKAVDLDRGSFRLAYNLALAYERENDYIGAAETWREALRRRPRRADHPDALNDEQVSRLWQRAAEAYHRAGDHDEANRVYQQAVKWAPDNLNLRLALAESLHRDGRSEAARNELERILERDPNHVPALLRLGEIYFSYEDQWWMKAQAQRYWEKALALQPNNPQVRQAMAEWYLDRGEVAYSWRRFGEAIQNYQKALEFLPQDGLTLAYVADCYIQLNDETEARRYIDLALAASADLDVYNTLISAWIAANRPEEAWEMVVNAESRGLVVPPEFYLAQALKWLRARQRNQAVRWVEQASARAAKAFPGDSFLIKISTVIAPYDRDLAGQYLEQAIAIGQAPAEAHLLLALLERLQGNKKASKKHLEEAERIARRTNDEDLAKQIEVVRMMRDAPPFFIESLLSLGGPGAVPDFLEDEFDEDFLNFLDEDDDEEKW